MGVGPDVYDETPGHTIDWDLELAQVEARAQESRDKRST